MPGRKINKKSLAALVKVRGPGGHFINTKPVHRALAVLDLGEDVLETIVARLGVACGPLARACAMAACAVAEAKPRLWRLGCEFARWRDAAAARRAATERALEHALAQKNAEANPMHFLVGKDVYYAIDRGSAWAVVRGRAHAYNPIDGAFTVTAPSQPTRYFFWRGKGGVRRESCVCRVRGRPSALSVCPHCNNPRARADATYVFADPDFAWPESDDEE